MCCRTVSSRLAIWFGGRTPPLHPQTELTGAVGAEHASCRPAASREAHATVAAAAAAAARDTVLEQLTTATGGDALAAEFVLLSLLSRVRTASTVMKVLGTLGVNLSRCSAK